MFPSIKALAEKTRESERSVQYQLRRMQEAGWLILVNAGNGGRSMHSEYRISLEWIKGAEIALFQKGANDSAKGCNPEQERVQPIAPANNRHRTINEPSGIVDADASQTKTAKAMALPDDFVPNENAEQLAGELGLLLSHEQDAFDGHHKANGSSFMDWQAAFRTWLRNSAKFALRQLSPDRPALARRPPSRGRFRWPRLAKKSAKPTAPLSPSTSLA